MNHARSYLRTMMLVAMAGVCASLAVLPAARPVGKVPGKGGKNPAPIAQPGANDTLAAAQQQYERHNYKQAMGICDRLLTAAPPVDQRRDLERLRVLCLCKLEDPRAVNAVQKAQKDYPDLNEDADLWLALGEHLNKQWNPKKAYEAFLKAAELYEKKEQWTAAADAYFGAAEQFGKDQSIVPVQQKAAPAPRDWPARKKAAIDEAIRIYEHIIVLKVDAGRRGKALLLAGQIAASPGDLKAAERAIVFWRRCTADYTDTPSAVQAQFEIGQTRERFQKYVEAVVEYEKVIRDFPDKRLAEQARQCVENIKAPQIGIFVTQPYLPGQKAEIYWSVRNVKKLNLTARKIDLVEAVAALHRLEDARQLRSAQGEEAAAWTFTTPDDGTHQFYSRTPREDVKQTTQVIECPLEAAGAYLVRAEGVNPENKSAECWCLVVLSNISAVAKADSDQGLVFVGEARSGRPVQDASVVVWRIRAEDNQRVDVVRGATNDAGLADLKFPKQQACEWLAAVRKGEDQAICARGGFWWNWWGYSERIKVYGFTDRPVYRPGQSVSFKQILRRHEEGVYANLPNRKVRVEIRDPKGETVYAKDLMTDEYGAVEGSLKLGDRPPLGVYYIAIQVGQDTLDQGYCAGNCFRVEEYKKPEFKVAVEPASPDYRVGDEMKVKISARYYFGEPVAGAEVKYVVRKQSYVHHYEWPRPWGWYYEDIFYGRRFGGWRPWWRPQFNELVSRGDIKTDDAGEAILTLKADPFKGHEECDLKFVIETTVTDSSRRVIRGGGEVKVTHAPFFIYPKPAQALYGPGDSVEIAIKTEDPNGKAVPGEFVVEAWRLERIRKVVRKDGREVVEFEEKLAQKLHEEKVKVPETGRASVRFVPDVTGCLRIIVRQAAAEKDRKPVEGVCDLWVASKTGAEAHYAFNDLKLIPDRDQYEIGQTLKVLVATDKTDSHVLLTGEADEILFQRVVYVAKNSAVVEIPVDKSLCPNFTLTACLLRDNKLYGDTKEIVVPPTHRFLKVAVATERGSMGGGEEGKYQPREQTKVRVTLTDMQTGKPVVGQVAMMLVDASVYYIQPEFREAVEKAFYGFTRQVNVQTTNSFAGPPSLSQGGGWGYGVGGGGGGGLFAEARNGGDMLAQGAFAGRPLKMSIAEPAATMAPMDKVKDDSKEAGGPPKLAEPVVREFFQDTVLWAGSVVTDADGVAVVPVTLPDQLTTFALHAVAFDKDTKVGQGASEVVTTKQIIVRLEGGRFFTEGDQAYVTVIAHNYFKDAKPLKVDLSATDPVSVQKVCVGGQWRAYKAGEAVDVTVPAGGEVRLDFLTSAVRPGEVVLTARAMGTEQSDAIQLTKPVLPWGAAKILASGGAMRGGKEAAEQAAEWALEVPREIKAGSQSLTVTLSPSIAAVAMDAMPYLAQYPYGCVEQTMSRFLPTVVMRRTLQDAGVSLDDVRKLIEQRSADEPKLAARYELIRRRMDRNPIYSGAEVDKMIDAGIKRLADMQHGDGGWGWWKHGESDPYMSAYVAYGLSVARDCDVKLPGGMLDKARSFLIARAGEPKRQDGRNWWWEHLDNDNTRVFMLYAISRLDAAALKGAKLEAHLTRIYKGRDDLSDYGRALLALSLHAAGRNEEAGIVVENFQNTVVVDRKTQSARWGKHEGWWYWYEGDCETTAWVLQAMMAVRPKDNRIPMAVNYLVANRRELHWFNTKTTAMVVYALARYAKAAGELDCDQTFEVLIDGAVSHTVRVTRENLFTLDDRIEIGPEGLAPGKHTVKVVRKGAGSLYWGAYLRYFDTAERIQGGGNQLAVERKYFRLIPEEFQNTRRVWKDGKTVEEKFPDIRYKRQPLDFGAEIASGEMIDVEMTIRADNNFEYVVFEDPKPAGCEPYRLTSGGAYDGGTYANMELQDTKIVFFADCIARGKQTLTYRLVCEQPGTFRVLPSAGEAMYSPYVQAISDSGKLVITTKPEK